MNKVNFEKGKKYPMNQIIFNILKSSILEIFYYMNPLVKENPKSIKKMWFYVSKSSLNNSNVYHIRVFKNEHTYLGSTFIWEYDAIKIIKSYRFKKLQEIFHD